MTLLNTVLRAVLPSLLRLVHPLRDLAYLIIPSLTLLGSVYPPVLSGFLMPSTVLAGHTRHRHTKPTGFYTLPRAVLSSLSLPSIAPKDFT